MCMESSGSTYGERILIKTERQGIHILCEEMSDTWQ